MPPLRPSATTAGNPHAEGTSRARVLRTLRACLAVTAIVAAGWSIAAAEQTDLDAFMRQVLAKRDENWKKQQQYVLDERVTVDMRGPGRVQLWGERRDYTWYIRDGFFVRSPVKVNGVTIGESDRRKYEADYLQRQQRRERRRAGNRDNQQPDQSADSQVTIGSDGIGITAGQDAATQAPPDVESLLRQTREPEFISSAYFLRFRFEEGKYALVGRETLDGRETLRIEYYPANLFRESERRRRDEAGKKDDDKAYDVELRRLMNKTALVTLWVEPNAHQIVKYTFDNIELDFLPAQWLLHMDQLHAAMTMGQPFPDVWLPSTLDFQIGATLAVGQFDVRYALEYRDYRRADVTTKLTIPKDR
jgi:hypothetical protein